MHHPHLRRGLLGVLVAVSAGLSACWTSASDGEALRRRVRELEQGQQTQREELQSEISNAQTKVAELEDVLGRATKVVQRASADTGAQVEQLQEQVMALEGQLAELRNELQQRDEARAALQQRLDQIARRVGIDMALDESEIPQGADEHWAAAEQAFSAEEFSRARALYRAFTQRHGSDERIDNAMYRIGASYLAEGRPATALGELRRVVSDHPEGDAADDALLGMARAFYALHSCTDARATANAMIRAHRRSPLLDDARELLREIQRAPRSYCTR